MTSGQVAKPKKLTFEQYLLTPYDGRRTEFVDGEIIEVAPPTGRHLDIVEDLGDLLKTYIRQHELDWLVRSGADIKIPGRDNSRNPDLLVCTKAQWRIVREQTKTEFLSGNPPLLTVEIVSPNNIKKDTQELVIEYAEAQVLEYWIVNPIDETVSLYVLDGPTSVCKGKFVAIKMFSRCCSMPGRHLRMKCCLPNKLWRRLSNPWFLSDYQYRLDCG